jgi:hypothetical protein
MTEADAELAEQMNKARANLDLAEHLWRSGNLYAMANRLSFVHDAAHKAEQRINDMIFRK